jgi:hypothetical protein
MAKTKKVKKEKKANPMSKYEKQGQSKIINSYGAVGTLIQTMNNGSLMIDDFDTWPYYKFLQQKYQQESNNFLIDNPRLIKDHRLLKRLVQQLDCNTLNGIFKMPENELDYRDGVKRTNEVISAHFFPMWFFCPKCGNMNYYTEPDNNPTFPRCCNMPKEQFSFVLVSEKSGEIADIPWVEFLSAPANQERINFNTDYTIYIVQQLKYQTGGSAEHLETKKVTATIDGQAITKSLGTLPAKIFIDPEGNEYKMAIRQGNNLCFVKTISSIYIPEYVIPNYEINIIKNTINTLNTYNIIATPQYLIDAIRGAFPNTSTNINDIQNWQIEQYNPQGDGPVDITEEQYKFKEFDFIINQGNYDVENEPISFKRFDLGKLAIKNLYRIDKLKVTHVQTGYSRFKPEGEVKKIYSDSNIVFYPGVEMKGEGMLLEMDCGKLNGFLNSNAALTISEVEAMVLSLSHCIMKELEFECGYPLNSLKERL